LTAKRAATINQAASHAALAASVLQAPGIRGDFTVFRVDATAVVDSGLEAAFRRNTAERVHRIEAAHNPEVAGSNPAPATGKALETGPFFLWAVERRPKLLPNFCPQASKQFWRW
jgi:hypothetical protein